MLFSQPRRYAKVGAFFAIMIDPERIRVLNDKPPAPGGSYVLYWMQQSQRAEWNHALEYAIAEANARGVGVLCVFGLTPDYPEANARHYGFMMEGLAGAAQALAKRGIGFVARHGSPEIVALEAARKAALVVVDRGYLRLQRKWRSHVASHAPCQVVQVESDVVVPVESASDHEEWSAATLRPRIHRQLERFLSPVEVLPVAFPFSGALPRGMDLAGMEGARLDALLKRLGVDRSVGRVSSFRGGSREAHRLLEEFIDHKLADYDTLRNEPSRNHLSQLSPYLHFGQISPLEVALRVKEGASGAGAKAFLEELIVRRELSMNFVYYNPVYDRYEGVPDWARRTLLEHASDPRAQLYSLERLEQAQTADPYWNTSQRQMLRSGKMHNYMRMYWGKKILEWTRTPEEAFEIALYLNNRYELDGRDANSFAGVAWCFGKHDRPWSERPIFGKVRYMNQAGLRRKFDMEAYVRQE